VEKSEWHRLKAAEDNVSLFLNGGGCNKTTHEGATEVEKLLMLKMLRMEFPHVPTDPESLRHLINHKVKDNP
jgi:hypothetical protein